MTEQAAGAGSVGRTAMALGFAGLLPQVAAVGVIALAAIAPEWSRGVPVAAAVAIAYPLIILSFLGGTWWGFAMRRSTRQGGLAALAVAPSLLALALLGTAVASGHVGWTLVAIGSAVAATLVVDRSLVARGDAPAGWMRLRVPLSLGLGGLTIVAGAIVGRAG